MPDLYVAQEIQGNSFKIGGGMPSMKVSWQVTGIRNDEWARRNALPVEQEKPEVERGLFMHPELYGQPATKSIDWARKPEAMRAGPVLDERLDEKRPAEPAETAQPEEEPPPSP